MVNNLRKYSEELVEWVSKCTVQRINGKACIPKFLALCQG
jgi:hypothetical protein